ncbi:MAG TPA: hypothetical protein VM846_13440 [Vicinamibacterales bacterium]|jgi:hypothetical protein|nr:hypothetical protein [Vicinamibacterales bacterium]
MATPTDDDHISSEALRFRQHAFRWRLINDDHVGIRPSPRHGATGRARRHIGCLVERCQQD